MEELMIELPEELTIYNVSEAKESILDKLKEISSLKDANLIFNCKYLEEIDAAGIQLLLSTTKTALQEEFSVSLDSVSEEIIEVLELAGVKEVLLKYDDNE